MIPWFAKRYIVPYGKPKTNVSVIQEPSSKVVNLNTQGRIILAKKERAAGGGWHSFDSLIRGPATSVS